ncbi:type II toxin-antitoxin system RatA family toxin [Candidatus Finniella inopinata]|uniref:Type II toxin-antitoxin system RatA family toxin n=1 Tax=Candidatus Finniella inopinata TaxID=1696036 RepID=A0A4Q7DHT0_9PROT|nr:type II toxin-antitoxin system RatA family toxin [Candidatus Finniella inopinata]RZI45858.1 type II toxin-antitoxin system RatA family toxin [Candidatus Finniella inopinata]
MTSFSTNKFLPYTPNQLFELVADVKSYPQFILGILETSVDPITPNLFKAHVRFGNRLFQNQYDCQVELNPFQSIVIKGLDGPFTHMNSQWIFSPDPQKTGTKVAFSVDFAFKNKLLQHLGGPIFHQLTQRMMQAFEERAKTIFSHF